MYDIHCLINGSTEFTIGKYLTSARVKLQTATKQLQNQERDRFSRTSPTTGDPNVSCHLYLLRRFITAPASKR